MSDTYMHNGTHDDDTSDMTDDNAELERIAKDAQSRRVKLVARVDQLVAERQVISDKLAQLRAAIDQCDKLYGTARTTATARGRKPAPVKGAKR